MVRPSRDARQFHTHRQLLARARAKLGATAIGSLDAIIVPASRPAPNLDHAVTLARALRCQLVVLCSRDARAVEVNELLASRNFHQGVTIDLPGGYTHPKLDFITSKLTVLDLPDVCANPNGDLSIKRNLGLLLARMLGWERIFFMDDDIRDLDSSDLRETASMLGPYRTVGMRAVDFPDNSVVCHGHRETGAYQDVFISGSVLAVHSAEPVAFFPEIYNEDWFFFYHDAAARRLGWSGRDATQLWYDPFADPQRAAVQEFGDVMAEGLYSLLHYGIGAERATSDYWKLFLHSRMGFLEGVLARTENVADRYLRKRIVNSVETAMACSRRIESTTCEQYIARWQQDLGTWEQRMKDVPSLPSAKAALRELDLTLSDRNPYVLAGIIRGNGSGVTRDIATGATVLIPSSLALSAHMIGALGLAENVANVTNNNGHLSFLRNAVLGKQRGNGFGRDLLDRISRFSWESAQRAILALAKERSKKVIASGESGRPITGRHRKPPELVAPAGVSDIEDQDPGQEAVSCWTKSR